MNNDWLTAFVLHRRSYRETSYIVDFFTQEQGKVSAVAKGVRNSKSEKKSLLQPFQPLKGRFSGKSELKNLRHVESSAPAIALRGTPLFCAMYVNERTNRIMPSGLASDAVYQAYKHTLSSLLNNLDIEITLRNFEFALLDEMGLLPDFTNDVEHQSPIQSDKYYVLQPEHGFCAVPQDEKAMSRRGVPGSALLALAQGEYTAQSKKVAKFVCRDLLKSLIGDKPLKSRELFSAGKG